MSGLGYVWMPMTVMGVAQSGGKPTALLAFYLGNDGRPMQADEDFGYVSFKQVAQ